MSPLDSLLRNAHLSQVEQQHAQQEAALGTVLDEHKVSISFFWTPVSSFFLEIQPKERALIETQTHYSISLI